MANSIEMNFDRSVDVKRKSGQTYADHLADVACHIQPLDENYTEDLQGNFGKTWIMFCGVADILEGDRIIDGSVEYRVVGVESYNFLNAPRHMEVHIRRSNA